MPKSSREERARSQLALHSCPHARDGTIYKSTPFSPHIHAPSTSSSTYIHPFHLLQQAYNAIAVSRQMKLMVLASASSKSSSSDGDKKDSSASGESSSAVEGQTNTKAADSSSSPSKAPNAKQTEVRCVRLLFTRSSMSFSFLLRR